MNCYIHIDGTEENHVLTVETTLKGTGNQTLCLLAQGLINVMSDFPGERELFFKLLLDAMEKIEDQK